MQTYILKESVLNDDTLYLSDDKKLFHGGYVAILKQYHYANAWHNKETYKRFKKRETLYKYLNKNYPNVEIHN
jgi:hypothetical protein